MTWGPKIGLAGEMVETRAQTLLEAQPAPEGLQEHEAAVGGEGLGLEAEGGDLVQAVVGGGSAIFHGGGGSSRLGMVSFGDATIPSREAIALMLSPFTAPPGWSSPPVNSRP
jgi:hypothetical protein